MTKCLGNDLLARALCMCIETATDADDLRDWWGRYNALIASLPEQERARVISAKDRKKAELGA